MAWIFYCVLWVSLTLASAYHNRYHFGSNPYSYDYTNFFYDGQGLGYRPTAPQRRIDHENYHSFHRNHDRMSERSAERSFEGSNESLNEGQNVRPSQRMNERSIQVTSSIQKVQEQERRRLGTRVEDSVSRIENGSYKIVNNNPRPHTTFANRAGQIENDRPLSTDNVIFPGATSRSSQNYVPDIPTECMETGICENVPNYPEEHVATVIQQLGNLTNRFKVDELESPEIAQRIGSPEEMELCDFTKTITSPQALPDKNGTWRYIINPKAKPLQGFHVEVCKAKGSPCSKLAYFYTGYEASCKQKYVLRHMTALDEHGKVIEEYFKLPSCCSCVVRQIE